MILVGIAPHKDYYDIDMRVGKIGNLVDWDKAILLSSGFLQKLGLSSDKGNDITLFLNSCEACEVVV